MLKSNIMKRVSRLNSQLNVFYCASNNLNFNIKNFTHDFSAFHSREASTYTSTLHLPKSSLPQYLSPENIVKRDVEIRKACDFESHYEWQFENGSDPPFVLHDGPPYANGEVHMGHAINKILKDITNRFWVSRGKKVHYKPGWDCHGLPIEQKVLKSGDRERLTSLVIREKARNFSKETIKNQEKAFKHWGIMGDWNHKYITSSPNYICNQLKAFWLCYHKGLIFQDFKPVFWSPSSCTALAEAELKYKTSHKSSAVFVEFKLVNFPDPWRSVLNGECVNLLVWTTTPWTLPANQAIAYSGNNKYCLVRSDSSGKVWVVAEEVITSLNEKLNTNLTIMTSFEAANLKKCTYIHPVYLDKILPLLEGSHVTMSKGTGLVHIAPNHGLDDFKLALRHEMAIEECLVNENGNYIESAGESLKGLNVLGDGTSAILKLLSPNLAFTETYTHSYPYDWRTNEPVIVRASKQWFLDVEAIKENAMNCLDEVNFYPSSAKISMKSTLESCPQWCISRQRCWGVPIPVFYSKNNGSPILTEELVNHFCHLVEKTGGADFWWSYPNEQLLPPNLMKKSSGTTSVEKGTDILDIWFDSGTSWFSSSLPNNEADLYLEGLDQFRGWFQSSLLTSVAVGGQAPYKSIYVHGFALDETGSKMSKSLGNVINPITITNGSQNHKQAALGVDTLRWWVAYYGSKHENVEVSSDLLKESSNYVNKIRNTFRFLLGNLNGFDPSKDSVSLNEMHLVDRYILHCLHSFQKNLIQSYSSMKYGAACYHLVNLFTNRLSAFYFPVVKDRLYCDVEDSIARRSCQTALYYALHVSNCALAPILPHLADEVRLNHPDPSYRADSLWKKISYMETSHWEDERLENLISNIESMKSVIIKQSLRNPMNLKVLLLGDPGLKAYHPDVKSCELELNSIFQTSSVELISSAPEVSDIIHAVEDDTLNYKIYFVNSQNRICMRCRLRNIDSSYDVQASLCNRCDNVLKIGSK